MKGEGKDPSVMGDQLPFVVIGFGAYVGEVLKRAMGDEARWDRFVSLSEGEKEMLGPGESLGNTLFIRYGDDGMAFPLSKVGKFLINGEEDSTYFFTKVMLGDRYH